MHQHLPLAFGERLNQENRGLARGPPWRRKVVVAQHRGEQASMGVGQFEVTPQDRPEPATFCREGQPELLMFSQPQRGG